MRILHSTDIHGNMAWFDWLARRSADIDLVGLTGDLLDLLDLHRMERQLHQVRAALERMTTRVAICSGNNDSFAGEPAPASLLHAAWLIELRRPRLHVDGDIFMAGGLQFRCIGWNSTLPTATGNEIWLYHAPPARSPLSTDLLGNDVGDEMLAELCIAGRGPALILTGHQHNPRHWLWRMGESWILNPGRGHDVSVPNYIVIDTDQRTVELHRGGESTARIHLGYPA